MKIIKRKNKQRKKKIISPGQGKRAPGKKLISKLYVTHA